ncbi:MAG: SMC family ATPase [Gemmatimonadota bacterium]|nr:SMC family ATPase [Gemmatimonadota bacterium]
MKIHRLRMLNFRQHARTEMVFGTGITAIIGPNGSGKTTVLEAIAWALYGQPAIRGQRDGVRFLGAGARAQVEVELDFELGGHQYRVRRGLTTASVCLDGAESAVANSISSVNELLARRMGMSRAEFFNTYFTGQKDLAVMAAMGTTERAQFLSRVLGYERLRAAQELARESRRRIGAEIVGLRSAMPEPELVDGAVTTAMRSLGEAIARSNEAGSRHARTLAEARRVTPLWEQAQREREQWQRLLAEITIVEREVENLTRDGERLASELLTIATVHEELAALRLSITPLAGFRDEIRGMDELFRQQGRRLALIENERALADELVRLRERMSRLESAPALEESVTLELEAARAQVEQTTRSLDVSRTAWVRDKQEAETKLQELRRQYGDVKQQRDRIVELGSEGICPTCNRVLGANFRGVIAQLAEQLETLQVDGQYYRDREEQLTAVPPLISELEERRRTLGAALTVLERKLAKVQAAVHEIPGLTREIALKNTRREEMLAAINSISDTYDGARHSHIRGEIERLAPMDLRAARLEAAVERAPAAQVERARIDAELAAATTKRAVLRNAGATREFSQQAYDTLRAEHDQASEAARTSELAVVGAQGEVRAAQQRLDTAEEGKREYERFAERMRVLNAQKLVHDELDNAFRDLRGDLNDALRPELSEIASSFLGLLTDGRYNRLDLDDHYDICILEDSIAKPVISGGEEDLANLVLRLAISQMIADRSGQPFSLLVLDEVFGSLDASRRDNVLELLHRLEDRFEQVILITHIESVREGVDRVIMVRYDEETGSSIVDGGIAGGASQPMIDAELLGVGEATPMRRA